MAWIAPPPSAIILSSSGLPVVTGSSGISTSSVTSLQKMRAISATTAAAAAAAAAKAVVATFPAALALFPNAERSFSASRQAFFMELSYLPAIFTASS